MTFKVSVHVEVIEIHGAVEYSPGSFTICSFQVLVVLLEVEDKCRSLRVRDVSLGMFGS